MLDKLLPELSADAADHIEDLQLLMKHLDSWLIDIIELRLSFGLRIPSRKTSIQCTAGSAERTFHACPGLSVPKDHAPLSWGGGAGQEFPTQGTCP